MLMRPSSQTLTECLRAGTSLNQVYPGIPTTGTSRLETQAFYHGTTGMTNIEDFFHGIKDLDSGGKDILVATVNDDGFGASLDQDCKAHHLEMLLEQLPGPTFTRVQRWIIKNALDDALKGPASSELEDGFGWRGTLDSPSFMAKNSELMELQVPEDPLFLMLRLAKVRAIPIALAHPLFGRFLDIANGKWQC
ncbi:hypothetical protein WJX74_010402 [Apatococcus lobatus]|uniref:Uncharacterized protein n=1 Tax=Apatococcus lobatus TaxID=904363 RepID=A0AAW1SGD1_9CHLO